MTDRSASGPRERAARLRVALVHDWLIGMRGGEKVLDALLRLFPDADVYTLIYDPRGVSDRINRRSIRASPLSSLPGVRRYHRWLLPLFPSTIDRLDIPPRYDLVLSTSHCVAHGVRAPAGARRLTYCFSPMRYIYDQSEAYEAGGMKLGARALALASPHLRRWDAKAARRCPEYWAISRFVADRVRAVYGREARVVHPPVDAEAFAAGDARADAEILRRLGLEPGFFLLVSALAPYKRADVAIRAANRLEKPLVVAGSGQMEGALRELAGPTVRMLGWTDDATLRALYRSCRATIFPGVEDFGIVPLEALACGKPVLGLRAGGLLETMIEGETAAFFDAPDPDALAEAWRRFDPESYDPARLRRRAEEFSTERFLDRFAEALFDSAPPAASNPTGEIGSDAGEAAAEYT